MGDLKLQASSYPGNLDTYTNVVDNVDYTDAGLMNNLADAIINIETELGTDPAGNLATVKAFLQTEHTLNGAHDDSVVCVLSGVQAIAGQKTFNSDITMGAGYKVDGVDIDQDILLANSDQVVNDTTTLEDIAIKLGDSTSSAGEEGYLVTKRPYFTDPGGSEMERTVISYTLPANSLTGLGDFVEIFLLESGGIVSKPPQGTSRLYFGGSEIHISTPIQGDPTTNSPQTIKSRVIVSGIAPFSQKVLTINRKVQPGWIYYDDVRIDNISEDLTSDINIKVTHSGATTDYVLRTFQVRYGRYA